MNRPFSNGTQRADWMCRNCDRCTKFNIDIPYDDPNCCAIDAALGQDDISDDIMRRMGVPDDVTAYTWDCPERVLEVTG